MCNDSGSPTVTNCTFSVNSAGWGGGMRNYRGSPTVTGCTFEGNSATHAEGDGGGISSEYTAAGGIELTVTNCLFIDNTAVDKGGGMANAHGVHILTNCTFIRNSANNAGGGIRNYSGDLTVTNCILWGDGSPSGPEISGGATVTYSDVQGDDVWPGLGNILANPWFVNRAGGDLRLGACSLCIDAGDSNSVPADSSDLDGDGNTVEPIPFDLRGDPCFPRFMDDANIPDTTGSGRWPIVDMGAYERQDDTSWFNVHNITQDVNYCSIQSAIYHSNDGDVIEVGPGTYDPIDFNDVNITVYSTHGPSVTFIDARGYGTAVTCKGGQGPSTVLEGFTITGGNANNGGGMYCEASSPTVTDCLFIYNTAGNNGGGMGNDEGNPTVTDCLFEYNTAGDKGGGMSNGYGSPTVTNCTFRGNSAGYGGGMRNYRGSPTVTNCTFTANMATGDGAGISNEYTAAGGTPLTLTNCLFMDNTADDKGGGVANVHGVHILTNCTFSGNSANGGGGGIRNYSSDPTVTNCILWGDTPDEISDGGGGNSSATYSNVQGGTGQLWFKTGCIDADPLFVNSARGDLRLVSYRSPCVDAGNNSASELPATDLTGNPRVVDGDEDGTATVDMGAYEFNGGPVRNLRVNRSYLSIQVAIDDPCTVNGDQIEVAPGIYYEAINFDGKAIRLYSSGGPDVTTIDGDGAYHVAQCIRGEGPNTILEGFTITGGNANGSGEPNDRGGGMYCENSSPTVTQCIFTGNDAKNGGGMCNRAASPTLVNCSFNANTANLGGGAILNEENSKPNLTNCTFSGNDANNGGGIYNVSSSPTLTNCILWGDEPNEIVDDPCSASVVTYSAIQASWSGEGNIDQNPLLRNVAEGDLSLAPWSSCIDDGNNAVVSPNATDITGLPRLVDGDCNTTVIVDMGAHEFRHAYGGDFDSSCLTDMADFAVLAWAWLASPSSDNWDPVCDISTPGDGRIDNNDLKVVAGNWLADVNTPITCDANRLKDEFGLDGPCTAAILSAAPCAYSPNDVAQALYDVGYSAAGAYQALTQVCGMTDGFAIEQILYNLGYPPDEYLESTALSFVKKFAPVLYFDMAHEGLPMSAQVYFETMMSPRANSPYTGQITWTTPWNGPCGKPGVIGLCGRDECTCGMQNNDFSTLVNGQIPTYYKVISDIDSDVPTGPKGRLRIAYWWFYGFQKHCNTWPAGKDGSHHGDWEFIWITTDPNRSQADAVTYCFHGVWYTRRWPTGFYRQGDRPVVYVGKLAHGNYHNDDHSGWMVGTPSHCCEYADYRDQVESSKWLSTYDNLVSLRGSEPWMLADRIGSLYEYYGQQYKISKWRWGPHISWCYSPFCTTWHHTSACGTHPTVHYPMDWDIDSCKYEGCRDHDCKGLVYTAPLPDYNQDWPW